MTHTATADSYRDRTLCSAGYNNALLCRENAEFMENEQVLFLCFGSRNHFAD